MKITDLPVQSLCNDSIQLIAPTMSRVEEMHMLISHFNVLHHEFLLWASRENSIDDVRENMRAAIQDFANDSNEYKFLIVSLESQKLLGCISLFIRNPQIPYYEIGYWLATDVLGRGLMTQACILVRNLALDLLKANRLEIRTAGKNIRSADVALRCGFRREAILSNERLDGHGRLDDTHIYLFTINALGAVMQKINLHAAKTYLSRIGFMKGKLSAPDNFNELNRDDISDMFYGK